MRDSGLLTPFPRNEMSLLAVQEEDDCVKLQLNDWSHYKSLVPLVLHAMDYDNRFVKAFDYEGAYHDVAAKISVPTIERRNVTITVTTTF